MARLFNKLRHDRPFYAWYLRERRMGRATGAPVTSATRLTMDDQSRVTEDGQERNTEG